MGVLGIVSFYSQRILAFFLFSFFISVPLHGGLLYSQVESISSREFCD